MPTLEKTVDKLLDKAFEYAEGVVGNVLKAGPKAAMNAVSSVHHFTEAKRIKKVLLQLDQETMTKLSHYYFSGNKGVKIPEGQKSPSRATVELLKYGILKPMTKDGYPLSQSFRKTVAKSPELLKLLGDYMKARS